MRWALGRKLNRKLWAIPKRRPYPEFGRVCFRVGRAGETRFTLCCYQERTRPPSSCPGHFPSYKGSVCCSSQLLLPPTFPRAPAPQHNSQATPVHQSQRAFSEVFTSQCNWTPLQIQEYLPWAKDPMVPLTSKFSLALPTSCRSPRT